MISVLAGKKVIALHGGVPQGAQHRPQHAQHPGPDRRRRHRLVRARPPLRRRTAATVGNLFGALGVSIELPESQIDAFTAICGCGPAYVFEFAAALRDAALALGFEPATAKSFAVETLLGAARLLSTSGVDPEVLRGQVTSPNGVTAAGLRKMADLDFRGMIREAVRAAKARAEELSV